MAQSGGSGFAPRACHRGLRGVCAPQDLALAAHYDPSKLLEIPAVTKDFACWYPNTGIHCEALLQTAVSTQGLAAAIYRVYASMVSKLCAAWY